MDNNVPFRALFSVHQRLSGKGTAFVTVSRAMQIFAERKRINVEYSGINGGAFRLISGSVSRRTGRVGVARGSEEGGRNGSVETVLRGNPYFSDARGGPASFRGIRSRGIGSITNGLRPFRAPDSISSRALVFTGEPRRRAAWAHSQPKRRGTCSRTRPSSPKTHKSHVTLQARV